MVYLIVNDKEYVCKIGYSENPKMRLISLQTGCPYPLRLVRTIEGDIKKEKEIHQMFEDYRMEGEWFQYNRNIKEFFKIELEEPVVFYNIALPYISHAEHRLLVTLSKYVEYNTNEFYLNVKRKEELVEITGLKYNTISQGLTRLVKKNLLLRVSNSTFQMNPNIMFKGEDLQRAKYIEITERYEICPECGEPEYEEKRNLKTNGK